LDIAIIGAGLMGGWHAHTARKLGACITGVCDLNGANVRKLANHYPGAGCFTSSEDLFSSISPDVVHICTPLSTHKDLCLASLEHGAHVVCEKPLAETADGVRQLYERARQAGKMICPVHQFAAQSGVRKAKRLLDDLGGISRIGFVMCSAGAEGMDAAGKDAIVADILPHPLSVMSCLWPGVTIEDLQWQYIRPAAGEVLAQCRFNGIPISLAISMSGRPTRCYMEIQGSRGSLLVDFFHGYCVRFPGRVSRFRKMVYPFTDTVRLFSTAAMNLAGRVWRRQPAYPGLEQLLREFYRVVEKGTGEPIAANVSVSLALARDRFLDGMPLPGQESG
jgi:predicted dehydrogenase